ncbi:acyltransferase [Rhizobium sp. R693]|uniref:acyltransferase n=1 Tax=Rhizobium sp. R693 TaxID=1764276 RepID=UPI000B52F12A|nr:acyltransferase [Rhizobium sp. R693]OWV98762.1 hypothetical protein ATY79_19050 [Rhizobium sp. R693]
MRSSRALSLAVFLFLGAGVSSVAAGETVETLIKAGLNRICADFAQVVSGLEGLFTDINPFGCVGAFQFCPATLARYFNGTVNEFLNDPKAQVTAWTAYEKTQWALATRNHLTDLVGQTIDWKGHPSFTVYRASILAACQFGCGSSGKLANFVKLKDCEARAVKDGSGVSVCKFLAKPGNKAVSCFTGLVDAIDQPEVDKNAPFPPAPVAASCGPGFGADGTLEVTVGKYTLRFGSSAGPAALNKFLDVLESRK